MYITIIKQGNDIKQILIGQSNSQIEKWVDDINNNPIVSDKWTIREQYTDKTLYELQKFFEID